MIIGSRIKERLDAIGKTQADLAREIGVSPQAISKLVTGGTNDTSKLYQIARFLRTTPEYLTGETNDFELVAAASGADGRQAHSYGPEADDDVVELDEIDIRLGLGGAYLDSNVSSEKRQFSRGWLRNVTKTPPELLYWAVGDGDSMEPTIRSGELLLIDRSETTPRMGDGIWACAYGEVGMIKRLRPLPAGGVEILSDNTLVPSTTAYDGELHVLGRVVAVVRRL